MIFKNGFNLPILVDKILRPLKYAVAGFFIWSIFFKMPLGAIEGFINSPYNILADIKMMQSFTGISMTALFVIIILIILPPDSIAAIPCDISCRSTTKILTGYIITDLQSRIVNNDIRIAIPSSNFCFCFFVSFFNELFPSRDNCIPKFTK